MLLVMEFVDNGCLSHYLRTHKKEMPQNNLLTFGEEIAEVSFLLSWGETPRLIMLV